MSNHDNPVEQVEKQQNKDDKKVKVTIVWGGTGASKEANVEVSETAGEVFNLVYQRFNQKPSDQDTFEVNDGEFTRAQFGTTVKQLLDTVGKELVFEVIPPTSGA